MKKKLGLLITAGAMSALLIVGSTLAWFTDEKAATNTFSMGNVAIDLLENGVVVGDESELYPNGFTGLSFDNAVPGDTLDKEVTVKNTGSVDSYVRVKLTAALIGLEFPEDTQATFANTDIEDLLDYNTTNWFLNSDGYYYYKGVLTTTSTSEELFSDVTLPGIEWGNEMANQDFTIKVEVEAIQANHIYDAGTGTFDAAALAAAWTSKTLEVVPVVTPQ